MRMSASRRPVRCEGFTLIELLVVIAIVGLLAAFAVPRLMDAFQEAKAAPGHADIKLISSALESYMTDNQAYPYQADAASIRAALTGGYLRSTTSFRNGWNKGYLYLTSEFGRGYVLVDLQRERHDDDPLTAGQQITIRCTDGYSDEERTFTVETGETASLTIPTVGAGIWQVPDTHIDNCQLLTAGLDVRVVTH
ncbi:MAG: type II secretion system protein [Bacillota bacterium]